MMCSYSYLYGAGHCSSCTANNSYRDCDIGLSVLALRALCAASDTVVGMSISERRLKKLSRKQARLQRELEYLDTKAVRFTAVDDSALYKRLLTYRDEVAAKLDDISTEIASLQR